MAYNNAMFAMSIRQVLRALLLLSLCVLCASQGAGGSGGSDDDFAQSLKCWLLSTGKLSSSCLAVQLNSLLPALEWHLLLVAFLPLATLSGQYRAHALVLKLLRKGKQDPAARVCHLVLIMATSAKEIATRILSSTWNATAMARSPVLEQTTLAPSTSPLDHGKKAICSLRRDTYSTPEIQAALSIILRTGGIPSSIPAIAMARISRRAFKECGTSAKRVGEALRQW